MTKIKAWVLGILVALSLLAGGVLYAASVTMSWTLPNTRVDGSALPIGELARTNIYCGTDVDNFALIAEIAAPAESLFQDFAVGTYLCAATAVDTDGFESVLSNLITIVISPAPKARPSPPVLHDVVMSGK